MKLRLKHSADNRQRWSTHQYTATVVKCNEMRSGSGLGVASFSEANWNWLALLSCLLASTNEIDWTFVMIYSGEWAWKEHAPLHDDDYGAEASFYSSTFSEEFIFMIYRYFLVELNEKGSLSEINKQYEREITLVRVAVGTGTGRCARRKEWPN